MKALRFDEIKNEFYFKKSFKQGGKRLTYAQALKLFKIDLPRYSELKSVKNLLRGVSVGTSQTGRGGERILADILSGGEAPRLNLS